MSRITVTDEIKKQMNELYLTIRTYAGVAREIGCSPSTVKRYIIEDYVSESSIEKIRFTVDDLPKEFSNKIFENLEDFGELCVLSEKERREIELLWSELIM